MIYGTGVDIVDITRFQRFVDEGNDAIFRRIFTEAELTYCGSKKYPAQHYALRFAAKEAFVKALGTGLREGLSWRDIEVVNDHYGKPSLHLQGRARTMTEERGIARFFLSLSHDGSFAVASVVLEQA